MFIHTEAARQTGIRSSPLSPPFRSSPDSHSLGKRDGDSMYQWVMEEVWGRGNMRAFYLPACFLTRSEASRMANKTTELDLVLPDLNLNFKHKIASYIACYKHGVSVPYRPYLLSCWEDGDQCSVGGVGDHWPLRASRMSA